MFGYRLIKEKDYVALINEITYLKDRIEKLENCEAPGDDVILITDTAEAPLVREKPKRKVTKKDTPVHTVPKRRVRRVSKKTDEN